MAKTAFSDFFEISRKTNEQEDGTQYTLKIRFQLEVDEHDEHKIRLIKLGDGSYGSVYLGRAEDGRDVAIKLLYDNQEIAQSLQNLTEGEISELLQPLIPRFRLDCVKNGSDVDRDEARVIRLIAGAITAQSGRTSHTTIQQSVRQLYEGLANTEPPRPPFDEFWDTLLNNAKSSAFVRFDKERSIATTLRQSLRHQLGNNQAEISNIVEVIGGTNQFNQILQELPQIQTYLTNANINYSDYVLVTKRYHYTLKDLLERKQGRKVNGYARLRSLPHYLRVCEALLIARQAAFGLQTLHNVALPSADSELHPVTSFFHLDIKPANIFIFLGQNESVEVALGDLGNLPANAPMLINQAQEIRVGYDKDDFAPGTRHYRSPEQKYHRDIADVSVIKCLQESYFDDVQKLFSNEELDSSTISTDQQERLSQLKTILVIRDPKFQNTLIEENDYVVFSKDNTNTAYSIGEIIRPLNEADLSGNIAYVLNGIVDKDRDEKTQVEFYKRQEYRTDLFGIGAVLFDMITAGSSPELFYESIRKYEGEAIDNIVRRYDMLRGGSVQGDNPDFAQIFKPFRHPTDTRHPYPPSDVIKLILKCMLYQSEGTFYQKVQDAKRPYEASIDLTNEINQLYRQYIADRVVRHDISLEQSILVHDATPRVHPPGPDISFHDRIDELQRLGNQLDDLQPDISLSALNRLLFGAYYFSRLTTFIRETIRKQMENMIEEGPTLLQIPPAFITMHWDNEALTGPTTFSAAALSISPTKDMENNRLELLIRSPNNPFVPNEIAGMRREIRLYPYASSNTNGHIACQYHFRDAAIVGREIKAGEWIATDSQIWLIQEPNAKGNYMELIPYDPTDGDDPPLALFAEDNGKTPGHVDATYFSSLVPLKYYFEMLAIYLQQLVFTYSPVTTTTSDRINIHALLRTFEIEPDYAIHTPTFADNVLRGIHEEFIHMLVRLTLHEAKGSFYQQVAQGSYDPSIGEMNPEMFDEISEEAAEIYNKIRKVLGVKGLAADHPRMLDSLESLAPQQDGNSTRSLVDELEKDPIDIERTIKSSGQIEGNVDA